MKIETPFVLLLMVAACAPKTSAPDTRELTRELARDPIRTPCLSGQSCNPIQIEAFPFRDRRDTRTSGGSTLNTYGCALDKDQSGGEFVYAFEVPRRSLLLVELDDEPGDEVDIDLHLLTDLDESACRARHNHSLHEIVEPGRYFIVADTFVGAEGTVRAGPYMLRAHLAALPDGGCAMRQTTMEMRWRECAPGIDCRERSAGGEPRRFLRLPTTGPVVKEAHLVTVEDGFAERPWPLSAEDGLDDHLERTRRQLPFRASLDQPWAPAGEGGSRWGQGSTGRPVPVIEEMWYITMNWANRPAPGTRMIVRNPLNGRAVVAAAGYETGPGSPTAIAGVSEEIHHYLGTSHRDDLMIGFAVDPGLPFGPVGCQ